MRAVQCDRCGEYVKSWKAMILFNKTDNTYLFCRERRAKWVKQRYVVDLCIACYKNVEIAIADNVGQVLFDEVARADAES